MRSSDGGSTWRSIAIPPPLQLLPSPVDARTIYVLTPSRELARSTDAGTTWTTLSATRAEKLFAHPTDANRLYAGTWGSGGIVFGSCEGLYRSLDGGKTWQLSNTGLQFGEDHGNGPFCPGINAIAFDPADPRTMYAAASEGWDMPSGVFKSVDGGESWSVSGLGIAAQISAVSIGGPSAVIYAGGESGLFKSTDGGSTWREIGLGLYGGGGSVAIGRAGQMVMNQGARTWRSSDSGRSWSPAEEGLTVSDRYGSHLRSPRSLGADPRRDGLFVFTSPNFNDASTDARKHDVLLSTNGGAAWLPRGPFPPPPGAPASYPIAIDSLHVDWSGAGRLFGFSGKLQYRTTDGGESWLLAGQLPGYPNSCSVRSVSTSEREPSSIWVHGDTPDCLFKSGDGGVSFFGVSGDLATSLGSGAHVTGFSSGADGALWAGDFWKGLFRSTDGGGHWFRSDASFVPGMGVHGFSVHPAASGDVVMISGGARATFRTTDSGLTWRNISGSVLGGSSGNVSLRHAPDGSSVVVEAAEGVYAYDLSRGVSRTVSLVVPIVLDVTAGSAHYTTELALANSGASDATLEIRYTASLGSKSGSGLLGELQLPVLRAGEQLVVPEMLSWLREKGLPLPSSASEPTQGGTLVVTFRGNDVDASLVSAVARTASATAAPLPVGRAGLAYSGIPVDTAFTGGAAIYGLRSSATDRSNVAIFNSGEAPVRVRVTVHSGSGDGLLVVHRESEVLPPWGWVQYNSADLLDANGVANGWVTVERTSEQGSFSCYGVVNDRTTNDGSFLLPVAANLRGTRLLVPAVVETSSFRSELVLANRSEAAVSATILFRESLSSGSQPLVLGRVTIGARRQLIIPDAIDYLRGFGTIPPKGSGAFAGILEVIPEGARISDLFAGSRTATSSEAGSFGVFTPALTDLLEASGEAVVPGLRQDADSRSNVAVFSSELAGDIKLRLQAHDGDDGGRAKGDPVDVTLLSGGPRWVQVTDLLGRAGVRNGWVRVTRLRGTGTWGAYGVVNDGGAPGLRTGDGAVIPMVR